MTVCTRSTSRAEREKSFSIHTLTRHMEVLMQIEIVIRLDLTALIMLLKAAFLGL